MASKIIMPAGLVEQPGYQYNRNRAGLVTIRTKFQCRAAEMHELMPPTNAVHPRFRYAGLDEILGVREEGDLAIIEMIFKGTEPGTDDADPPPVYKLLGATREEPLRTFTAFKDFTVQEVANVEKWLEDPDAYTGPSFGTGTALSKYATKRKNGVEAYMVPTLIWREESAAKLPLSALNELGKIDSPPGGAPSLASGRNWLLTTAESEKQGSAYKRWREWMASGPGGWDPDLYS